MQTEGRIAGVSNGALWTGRILSALVIIFMIGGGLFTAIKPEAIAQQMTGHYGYPAGSIRVISIIEIICALIYWIPQTAVFGAVLVTAYLGGAVSTHVRAGEAPYLAIIFGIIMWVGLYLREPRLKDLAPVRKL
jgi:hypothetical protein